MVDTKDTKKIYAIGAALVILLASGVYVSSGMMNKSISDLTTDGGVNNTTAPNFPIITSTDNTTDNDTTNNTLPLPLPVLPSPDNVSGGTSGSTDEPTVNPVPTEHTNPNLHMSVSGGAFEYGVPNHITVTTTENGPIQPTTSMKIASMIHISGVDNKSVEVRTYSSNPDSRLVNLYGDGQGGCYGILVKDWSTWDYTWEYQQGVSVQNIQQISVNVSAYGDFKISFYAIHDDGDRSYDIVSNTNVMSFSLVKPTPAFDNYIMRGGNKDYVEDTFLYGSSFSFVVRVDRNGYVGTIHNRLLISESNGPNKIMVNGETPTLAIDDMTWHTQDGTFRGQEYDVEWWSNGDYVEYTISLHPYDSQVHILFESESDDHGAMCEAYFHTTI